MALRRIGLFRLAAALLALGPGSPVLADAAVVSMTTDAPECGPYVAGVGACTVGDPSITVTWELDAAASLNGYDFEIRWDPTELALTDATQLHPDTGTPLAFLEAPSDPNDSRALVVSLTAASTTRLFELTFDVASSAPDGMADLWWFANGNGLAPGAVILGNPAGAGVDLATTDAMPPAAVPASSRWGLGLLAGALVVLEARARQQVVVSA